MHRIFSLIITTTFLIALSTSAFADIKVRQKVTMSGQTYETTKMIKGARERTENKGTGPMAAMMSQVATITQCDLRRTVQLNDGKQVYFIETFAEENEATPVQEPATRQSNQTTKRGGTVTMTFTTTDTGERKTLFGLTARHVITVMETESSQDSCGGANRSKMEIDAWYVDFSAEFNCPISSQTPGQRGGTPDCQDRVIVKQNGKGKTGFLLNGTTKFFAPDGSVQMTQTIETLELSRETLEASLFEIPQNYKLVSSSQELYSMPSMTDLMRQQNDKKDEDQDINKNAVAKTVGININSAGNTKINQMEISAYLRTKLSESNFEPRAGASDVDYVLNVDVRKVKESAAGKVGGIFGKVTGVETKTGNTEVELIMTLTKAGSANPIAQSRISQKFDGVAKEAMHSAIDKAIGEILSEMEVL